MIQEEALNARLAANDRDDLCFCCYRIFYTITVQLCSIVPRYVMTVLFFSHSSVAYVCASFRKRARGSMDLGRLRADSGSGVLGQLASRSKGVGSDVSSPAGPGAEP